MSKHSVTNCGLRVVTTCWSWAWSNRTSPSKCVRFGSPLAACTVYGDLTCSVHTVNNLWMFNCQCNFYLCNRGPYVRLAFVPNMLSSWNKDIIIIISEDSDQPGHPPSLIRVFAVHSWVAKVPLLPYADSEDSDQDWSDWADAQADLSLRWTLVILLVLLCGGSYCHTKQIQNPNLDLTIACIHLKRANNFIRQMSDKSENFVTFSWKIKIKRQMEAKY